MKFAIEGREYDYDGKITVDDAMFIHDKAHVGVIALDKALLVEGNPYVIAAWMYILKRRASEAVRWEDMLKLDVRTFTAVFDDSTPPEPETPHSRATGPDPTSPNGKSRRRATTPTS